MKEQCPHCHNVVSGQFSPSETRKWLTSLAKKGGMKAVLTAAGSVIPGFGNIGGFIAGTALDVIYGKDINKLIDKIADEFDDNKIYVFECPNCGHTWTHEENEILHSLPDSNYVEDEEDEDMGEDEGDDPMAVQFDQSLEYLLNETAAVIKSSSTVETFMNEMDGYASRSKTYLCGAFHFLAGFAGLLFTKNVNPDDYHFKYVASESISQIETAISLTGRDEYKLIKCLLKIQTAKNINDLLQHVRVATACKVNEGSWLKKKYYRKSLVPDICFFKILEIDSDETVSDEDKAKLWRTLVNSPVQNYRMYANLNVYQNLPDTDKSAQKYLKAAYETKGYSLDRPDMTDPMYEQWLFAAGYYAEILCTGESELIGRNRTLGMKMLLTIADLGNINPCLSARSSLGDIAEEEGDLQKALVYFIKAGEWGADDAIRIRKMIADNHQSSNSTSTEPLQDNATSDVESEYVSEVKACIENGGEISKGERRLLEKLRIKLGITEERVAELEQSLKAPQLTEDEQEYLAEYRECLAEGGKISAGERRLLNRLRDKLGISEKRASELEQIG